jgi:hypothetical protein
MNKNGKINPFSITIVIIRASKAPGIALALFDTNPYLEGAVEPPSDLGEAVAAVLEAETVAMGQ